MPDNADTTAVTNPLGQRRPVTTVTLTADQLQVGDVIFHEEVAASSWPSAWRKVLEVKVHPSGTIGLKLASGRGGCHAPYAPIRVQVLAPIP